MIERKTILSDDRIYRYTLWREWDFSAIKPAELELGWDGFKNLKRSEDYVQWIGLNPSTADETVDDQTIRVCQGFAKRWGYGAMCMTNLFAFRSTNPEVMKKEANPAGEHNMHHLLQCASEAALVIAAWGCDGTFLNQDLNVKEKLGQIGIKLHCLIKTADGHPRHPLRIKADTRPVIL